MRSLPVITLIIIIAVYFLISLTSLLVISETLSNSRKVRKYIKGAYLFYSILLSVFFGFLFIYPGTAANSGNYTIYFIFNIVLIADLTIKVIITFSYLCYLFISVILKNRYKPIIYAGFIISLGAFLNIIYGAFLGCKQYSVETVELKYSNLPRAFNGFSIAQVSDTHLGSFNGNSKLIENLVGEINAISPDIVVLTGDLVNNFSYETRGWDSIFSKINAKYGKYAIMGNHDYGDYYNWKSETSKQENLQAITKAYKDFGFNLLRNQTDYIKIGADSIFIHGVENWGHPPFPQYADLENTLKGIPDSAFSILLSHDPAHWESEVSGKEAIELTLSGHTHGLQWGLKPAGIEFSLIYANNNSWGGLYGTNGQFLYVNRGCGTIGLRFRLDMPAELTLIKLTRK